MFTPVQLSDALPLTCSRSGSCCHGNRVRLNPWELHQLAKATNLSVEDFQDRFTTEGGVFLRFEGKSMNRNRKACNLYLEDAGCSVHPSRPLACRLFPLGRVIQNNQATYMHPGKTFPCLSECSEVLDLPKMTVETYLSGQETAQFEQAQDGYLEIVQNLADIALGLLIETDLQTQATLVLAEWKKMSVEIPADLKSRITESWYRLLSAPPFDEPCDDLAGFLQQHNQLIEETAEAQMNAFRNVDEVFSFTNEMMAMALLMAHSIGAEAEGLGDLWIAIASSELGIDE